MRVLRGWDFTLKCSWGFPTDEGGRLSTILNESNEDNNEERDGMC